MPAPNGMNDRKIRVTRLRRTYFRSRSAVAYYWVVVFCYHCTAEGLVW